MELTQEYFDKGIANLMENMATKDALAKLEDKLVGLEAKMVTKDELKIQLAAQSKELKQYTAEAFEVQQEWMDERFNELIPKYDVRDRATKLEKDVAQLKLNRPAHA
jgi:hypothetical protein